MSSVTPTDEQLSARGWRNALPARWLPMFILLLSVFGVEIAYQRDMAEGQQYQFYLEPLAWVGFATLPALFAMTHSAVWIRLLLLLISPLPKLVCDLVCMWLLQSQFFLPDGEFASWRHVAYEAAQRYQFDLHGFGLISIVMHGATAVCSMFVSSRSTTDVEQTPIKLGSIFEWIYFAFLVALVFMPKLSSWQLVFPSDGSEGVPMITWPNMQILLSPYVLFPLIGVPLVGLLVLAPWRAWWFKALVLIAHLSVMLVFLMPQPPVHWEWIRDLLIDFGPVVLLSLPHWLLIRLAGYRLSAPRGWIRGLRKPST
jgi:hypothetical protein